MPENRKFSEVAGNWRAISRLLPVYAQLAEEFHLAEPPVKDVRALGGTDHSAIDAVMAWMDMIDENTEAHHFRQILQTTDMESPEDKLAALIHRFLEKTSQRGQEKLDFCLTQYLAVCAPPLLHQVEPTLEDVAGVLQPVLGTGAVQLPPWLEPLEMLIEELRSCKNLGELDEKRIIESGRQLKKMARAREQSRAMLAVITRFNFLVRQNTYRLLQSDIKEVEKLIAKVEERRVETLDCTSLGLSAEESLGSLRQLCDNWKRPSVTEYTQFQFARLLQLRTVLERATAEEAKPAADARVGALMGRVEALTAEVAELRDAMLAMQSRLECAESAISFSKFDSSPSPAEDRTAWAEEKTPWVEEIGCVESEGMPENVPAAAPTTMPLLEVQSAVEEPMQAAAAPAVASEDRTLAVSQGAVPDETLIEAIAEILPQLRAAKVRNRHVPTLQVAGTALLLTAAEMQALLEPAVDADGMRGVVGAKILLISAMQQRDYGLLERALKLAGAEAERDEKVAARHRKSPEVAEAWAAAIKQLRFIMQRAQEAGKLSPAK